MNFTDVLLDFRDSKLGLLDNELRLVPHQKEWATVAERESSRILRSTDSLFRTIDHIGSTAVRDISAKPILDFVGVAKSLEGIDACSSRILGLGYKNRGEFGIKDRRFLTLNDADGECFVHLHVFLEGDIRIREHQVFRDYLNAKLEARLAYEDLKQRITLDSSIGRSQYSAMKADGLNQLLHDAKLWSQSNS